MTILLKIMLKIYSIIKICYKICKIRNQKMLKKNYKNYKKILEKIVNFNQQQQIYKNKFKSNGLKIKKFKVQI